MVKEKGQREEEEAQEEIKTKRSKLEALLGAGHCLGARASTFVQLNSKIYSFMWSSVLPGMDVANNNILYKRPHVTCRRGPLLYGRLSPYFVFFPFCQPQSLQDSQAPAIAADAFNGLQQAASRREADKNFAPKSEEQNGGTKNQFAEAMLVYTTCRIIIPLLKSCSGRSRFSWFISFNSQILPP